jgi:hypothetical protein
MNDNYKADEASARSEKLDAAEQKVRLAVLLNTDIKPHDADYVSQLEDYLLDDPEFFRCTCCARVAHKDIQKNLCDEFGNSLDIFVCETCKEAI